MDFMSLATKTERASGWVTVELVPASPVSPVGAEDVQDLVSKAMRKAWQLGQTYWQQADSEFLSQQAKSDATQAKFHELVDETRAAISTQPAAVEVADEREATIRYDVLHDFAVSHRINYNELCRVARAALADNPAPAAAAGAQQAIHALEESKSVISSINRGSSARIKVGDDVCYWQREEWVGWAVKEVLPLIDAALATTPEACRTCNGHGLIGGFVGGPDHGGYDSELCPDCNQPAKAEVQAEPVATQVPASICEELDNVLTDPDSKLSTGAERALRWMRSWVSVPLFTSPQATQQDAIDAAKWRFVQASQDHAVCAMDRGHGWYAVTDKAIVAAIQAAQQGGDKP